MARVLLYTTVLTLLVVLPIAAQQTQPVAPQATSTRITGVTVQLLDDTLQASFAAAQEAAAPSQYQCRCQPELLSPVLGLITTSGTTIGCKVPFTQLGSGSHVDCTLAASTGEALFQVSTDVSTRNKLLDVQSRYDTIQHQLTQCQNLGIAFQAPQNIQGTATSPSTAEVTFDGTPCASSRVQLRAVDGETKEADGRWDGTKHVAIVSGLTPMKPYNVKVWLQNATGSPIATPVAMTGQVVPPADPGAMVTTSTPKLMQTPAGVRVAGTANHPGELTVEIANFDKNGIVPGTIKRKQAPVDSSLAWTADFDMPRPTAATIVKYRLLRGPKDVVINDWVSTVPLDVVPLLRFASPLRITITPVGPVVSWTSTVVPTQAQLILRISDTNVSLQRMTTATPTSAEISLALKPDDAKWLQDQAANAVHPVIIAKMVGTSVSPADEDIRELQLDIVKTKEEVAAVMQNVTLSEVEKTKLKNAAQNAVVKWAESVNWGNVLGWLVKAAAAAVK